MAHLNPCDDDSVVEFAPGLGVTARIALAQQPRSYVGIEREPDAARLLQQELGNENVQFVLATAESTGLHSDSASLVFGEAMLSMQTPGQKQRILAEAFRILKPGGRYGIHELALLPNEIPDDERKAIEREMSTNIHVGVRPATLTEWKRILEAAGFHVDWEAQAPMHLLEPKRLLNDEGPTWRIAHSVQLAAKTNCASARFVYAAAVSQIRLSSQRGRHRVHEACAGRHGIGLNLSFLSAAT